MQYLVAWFGLLASADLGAASRNGFLLDDASVPVEQIMDGGPGRDGIPALDRPRFVSADDADFLRAKDRVLGVSLHGDYRAYPVKILNYHEIVNDLIGGQAIVITYCPLCGTGMAFFANVNGRQLTFGVSGLLYNSDVLLFDRQTESLWSQLESVAITGSLKGAVLNAIPMSHTTWRDWQARYPNSRVLSTDTGYRRDYRSNPYPNYRRNPKLLFPVNESSRQYRQKSLVLGLEIDGRSKAYPFAELKRGSAQFQDEFGGEQFEVRYDEKNQTARIMSKDGNELPTVIAYWFAWYAFHPDTMIYTGN